MNYLILAKIIHRDLFDQYIQGHLPTIAQYGGKLVFRSTGNRLVFGKDCWDAIAIHAWPDKMAFTRWWTSPEYAPWAKIRDQAATVTIIRCGDAITRFFDLSK